MELSTRCPECGTVFKASLADLKLRKGYVRCVHCAHIFDGYAEVLEDDAVASSGTAAAAAPGTAAALDANDSSQPANPVTLRHSPKDTSLHVRSEARPGHAAPAEPAILSEPTPQVLRQGRAEPRLGTLESHETEADTFTVSRPQTTAAPVEPFVAEPDTSQTRSLTDSSEPYFSDSAFIRTARPPVAAHVPIGSAPDARQSQPSAADLRTVAGSARAEPFATGSDLGTADGWSQPEPFVLEADPARLRTGGTAAGLLRQKSGPGPAAAIVRALSQLLFWLLMLLLLAQTLYVFRAQLARFLPATRPLLEQACMHLHCDVPYARQIDLISITSSSLKTVDTPGTADEAASEASQAQAEESLPQHFVLQLVMRNQLSYAQEWPTLVLDLRDAAGTRILRRNLDPDSYLSADVRSQPLPALGEARIQLPLAVEGARVNGYQLDLFFP